MVLFIRRGIIEITEETIRKMGEYLIVYSGQFSTKFPQNIQRIALRKLIMLNNSLNLSDLAIPPAIGRRILNPFRYYRIAGRNVVVKTCAELDGRG
jgi:hypothetical protein